LTIELLAAALRFQNLERRLNSNSNDTDDQLAKAMSELNQLMALRAADASRHARDLADKTREIERLHRQLSEQASAHSDRIAIEVTVPRIN
jgi:2,3-bisphosphoglycerate-independent phosphoglycerate mutase